MFVVRAAVANLVENGKENWVLERTLVHEEVPTSAVGCSLDLVCVCVCVCE